MNKKPNKPEGNISLSGLHADSEKHKQLFQEYERSKSGSDRNNISFNPEIYAKLPWILYHGCEKLIDQSEKEVFLISALGVLSGLLPNVHGFYDTQFYSPNLYTYVLGKYGSGKGSIQIAKMLGFSIHSAKLADYHKAQKVYNQEMLQYKRDMKAFQNDKNDSFQQPEEPVPPPHTMLFIPVNNSKSGMLQLLDENQGRGVMFETEGDTLADAIKQDYGNYSDGLRKAFHHEAISFYRRAGKEFREIEHPVLSVILSSTFDQFQKLIPDIHNGLFSRFCYYIIPQTRVFKNVFDKQKHDYPKFFSDLGNQVAILHDQLKTLDRPILFQLSAEQQQTFLSLFQEWKDEFGEFVSDDLDGTINRLGLIFFRIAMILTTLRTYEDEGLLREITCSDLDFSLTLSITQTLKQVSLRLFYWFPVPKKPMQKTDLKKKASQMEEAFKLRSTGMSYQKISEHLNIPKTSIFRWLNQ